MTRFFGSLIGLVILFFGLNVSADSMSAKDHANSLNAVGSTIVCLRSYERLEGETVEKLRNQFSEMLKKINRTANGELEISAPSISRFNRNSKLNSLTVDFCVSINRVPVIRIEQDQDQD